MGTGHQDHRLDEQVGLITLIAGWGAVFSVELENRLFDSPNMAHPSIVELTSANFEEEVTNATVPVLVDFWAEWCGPCKMLGPVLDELATEKGDAVKICKVNLEAEGNDQLAAKFSVRAIPALLFFKDGEVKDTHSGLMPKDQLASKLAALA